MKYGTLNFYSTTASLIPLGLLTYIFSLQAISAIGEAVKAQRKGQQPYDYTGCLMLPILLAPPTAVIAAIIGEINCLMALFSGKPTSANARWAVYSLIVSVVVMALHIVCLGLTRYYRSLERWVEHHQTDKSGTPSKNQ